MMGEQATISAVIMLQLRAAIHVRMQEVPDRLNPGPHSNNNVDRAVNSCRVAMRENQTVNDYSFASQVDREWRAASGGFTVHGCPHYRLRQLCNHTGKGSTTLLYTCNA